MNITPYDILAGLCFAGAMAFAGYAIWSLMRPLTPLQSYLDALGRPLRNLPAGLTHTQLRAPIIPRLEIREILENAMPDDEEGQMKAYALIVSAIDEAWAPPAPPVRVEKPRG